MSFTLVYRHDDSPYPVTGATVVMQIKRHANDPSAWITVDTGANGGIVIGGVDENIIDIDIGVGVLDQEGQWVYDVELTEANGYRTTIAGGPFVISEDVTNAA